MFPLLFLLADVLNLNVSTLEFVLGNDLLRVSSLVNRLAVQWEPGAMIAYASYNGKCFIDA